MVVVFLCKIPKKAAILKIFMMQKLYKAKWWWVGGGVHFWNLYYTENRRTLDTDFVFRATTVACLIDHHHHHLGVFAWTWDSPCSACLPHVKLFYQLVKWKWVIWEMQCGRLLGDKNKSSLAEQFTLHYNFLEKNFLESVSVRTLSTNNLHYWS